ncbi:MAG: methyl-accepting chemotaxis protein [Propionivibrio sp.]|nr:methyl-accepting chemotaxis protein [Propionivibrio sp.]
MRLRYRVRSLEFAQSTSDAERAKISESLNGLDKLLGEALKKYEPMIASSEEKRIYDELVKAVAAYRATVQEVVALAKAGKNEEVQQIRRTTWVKAADQVRDQTDALQKLNAKGADATTIDAAKQISKATVGGLSALGVGVVLALLATFLIARSICGRLASSVEAAQRIANGDLTSTPPSASKDEVGLLIVAMNEMQHSLRDTLLKTRDSAASILNCSAELTSSVRQMEESADIQSSAAAAIASDVEEVTVSINHVSANTSETANFAQGANDKAQAGYEQIERLIARIGEVANMVRHSAQQIACLEDESEKISNIVSVIKDIADQTNLLALNAAIEAARAGEQGRGFAVVADEVRKLSERTALSTGEIEKMVAAIQRSTREVVGEVSQGVALVEESVHDARKTGELIGSMQEMARKVSQLVDEIAEAMNEQSSASNDVARKVEDVATQTEEATAIARKTGHAAECMSKTAHDMQQQVAHFRI